MQAGDRRLQERLEWLRQMLPHVRPGKIVEFGCGSGFVLEFLAKEFPASLIVGIDKSAERLAAVVGKGLANVIPVRADISRAIFPPSAFNTALFVAVLHEIFSAHGRDQVVNVLKHAANATAPDGAVIIQDFLRPAPASVEMGFNNEETRAIFLKFAAEFRPRRIEFETAGDGVRLDIGDAVEFVSKYRTQTEEDWDHEMDETHFFSTEQGFRDLAASSGLKVDVMTRLPVSDDRCRDWGRDIVLDMKAGYGWVQLVLKKAAAA